MAKDFAKDFYNSPNWKATRKAYYTYRLGWCEECMKQGKYTRGEIVHHIEELTPENINDPAISLSFDNLKLVCRNCHAIEHGAHMHRYIVDEEGRIIER